MRHNSSNFPNNFPPRPTHFSGGEKGGQVKLVLWCLPSRTLFPAIALMVTTACGGAGSAKIEFTPPPVVKDVSSPTSGAIFKTSTYAPLTSGAKAARVGDILTIVLAERTAATKSSSSSSDKNSSFGLTPPATGPLSLFSPSDVNISGGQSFNGKGDASQSNTLSGTVTVTVAEVLPNGVMRVRGEKLMTLNRGDERIQLSGLVRQADISPDNRVLSTRVADAQIAYFGKGEVANASKQGWLQRFFSAISPF